ncbi:unnamed protein product [Phaedon cochleariae]|uniref:Uncharacterized protein n=1 Tax=Phaedon cochleariae TaxID=80249 RepID=A0A9P0DIG1_PHACE|nr:unnamed protein product [Phaedon cochleariae]
MEKVKENISVALYNFTNSMDKNNRGIHIGCYSIATIGLALALRKVRPFSKFKKPSDIPNMFIKEKRELTGLVDRIDPKGPLLMIQHKPLIDIRVFTTGQLPVKISGVNVSGLGVSWLQSVLSAKEVKFVPVVKGKDFVECQVYLTQLKKINRKQGKAPREVQEIINIGENMVKIGFAVPVPIEKPLTEDVGYLKYYAQLQNAEKYALRKKLGLKYYIKPTKTVLVGLYAGTLNLAGKSISLLNRWPKIYVS